MNFNDLRKAFKGIFAAIISMYVIFLLIAGSSNTTPVPPTTGNFIAFEDKRKAPGSAKILGSCIHQSLKANVNKFCSILIFLAKPTYQCPGNAPYLEKHDVKGHGDVCRKFEGDTSMYECPHGCLKIYQVPYCIAPSATGPCRVPKGNLVP